MVLGFFRTSKRAFEAKPGEHLILDITDVPQTSQQEIRATLRSRGLPVTDDNVRGAYATFLNTNRIDGSPSKAAVPESSSGTAFRALTQFTGALTRGVPAPSRLGASGPTSPPTTEAPRAEAPKAAAPAVEQAAAVTPKGAAPASPTPVREPLTVPTPAASTAPAKSTSSAPVAAPQAPERAPEPPAVYTAPHALEAILSVRNHGVRSIRIPGETENLAERERFLREFLRLRHSLTPGGNADGESIVTEANYDLSRIEAIRRGEIQPSEYRKFLKAR